MHHQQAKGCWFYRHIPKLFGHCCNCHMCCCHGGALYISLFSLVAIATTKRTHYNVGNLSTTTAIIKQHYGSPMQMFGIKKFANCLSNFANIVQWMESMYGVIGQVRHDNGMGKPYLHIDASVQSWCDDSSIDHRWQYNATALTVDAHLPNKLLNHQQGQCNHDTPGMTAGRWKDCPALSRSIVSLQQNNPYFKMKSIWQHQFEIV